jgi:hypothetical protein
MVDQGFIRPGDLNVNILQGPKEYRIDNLPMDIKLEFKEQFEQHIDWLKDKDHIHRATGGFESAINFMMSSNSTELLQTFWETASDLDWSRNERIIDAVPELSRLLEYKPSWTRV